MWGTREQFGGRTADVTVEGRRLETGAGIVYDGNAYMVPPALRSRVVLLVN